jgi:xylose isomerase
MGCGSLQLWPGSDGWDYNFEVNYGKQLDWFIEGCIEISNKAKEVGLVFGTEAKHKEPREGNMILYNTAKAACVVLEVNKACGHDNMGVVIDYGHEQMVGTEPADNLYFLKRMGVPIRNFHVNSARFKSNDEDRICGSTTCGASPTSATPPSIRNMTAGSDSTSSPIAWTRFVA